MARKEVENKEEVLEESIDEKEFDANELFEDLDSTSD